MKCPSPISLPDPKKGSKAQRITVPCGKCGACKANRRSDWTFRLKQELKIARNGWFITLTYDEENLPFTEDGLPTLDKRHWQNFVKKLRKRIRKVWPEESFRYYTVGEYGTKTGRPHYHTIGYNIPLNVLSKLSDIWGLGHVYIGDVEDASLHYVTKFHVNTNNQDIIDEQTGEVFERVEEFATMSRGNGKVLDDGTDHKYRYGIGHNYVKDNADWHQDNEYHYVNNNGFKQRLPQYYRDKIFDPVTRQAHLIRIQPELDKNYRKEIERLKRLKIENPESYILKSQYEAAKKVKHKAQEGNTF